MSGDNGCWHRTHWLVENLMRSSDRCVRGAWAGFENDMERRVMIMGNIDPQVFGGLIADVKTLMKQTEQSRDDQTVANNILFAKIDNLSANGCVQGEGLRSRIKVLEEKPAKLVAIGSMILVGLAVLGGACVWLYEKFKGLQP